jgi:hypothetical protein
MLVGVGIVFGKLIALPARAHHMTPVQTHRPRAAVTALLDIVFTFGGQASASPPAAAAGVQSLGHARQGVTGCAWPSLPCAHGKATWRRIVKACCLQSTYCASLLCNLVWCY